MQPIEFLQAELDHAQRQLARLRRIAAAMQANLEAAGLDELAVYEKLANHKAYRQLQRDQNVFHQLWLRLYRQLLRLPPPQPPHTNTSTNTSTNPVIPFDQAYADILNAPPKPAPYRKPPTPGPNQKCLCGSGLKYKRCCGNPLRRAAA